MRQMEGIAWRHIKSGCIVAVCQRLNPRLGACRRNVHLRGLGRVGISGFTPDSAAEVAPLYAAVKTPGPCARRNAGGSGHALRATSDAFKRQVK